MKNRIKLVALCGLLQLSAGHAEMLKCLVQKAPDMTGYFDSTDNKTRQKCLTTPIAVLTVTGEAIKNDVKPTRHEASSRVGLTASLNSESCGGSGGTVRVNGRIFHLTSAKVCGTYGIKGKGSITAGYIAGHVRLGSVDKHFRRKIAGYVNKTARKYGMDPAFIHAIISAESAYNPNARSHVGAMGLMQLMPFTAKRFGVRNAYDPYQNIDAGTRYLKLLYNEFGSFQLAAAGYNAGEGAVRKYHNNIPPYRETQKYVPKVMGYYRRYKKNKSLISLN